MEESKRITQVWFDKGFESITCWNDNLSKRIISFVVAYFRFRHTFNLGKLSCATKRLQFPFFDSVTSESN